MPAAAYSVQCPSCGAPFLATQTRPTSITTCPHCAYNAPLQAFQAAGTSPLGTAAPLPLRRRDPRSSRPPPPSEPPLLTPPMVGSAAPSDAAVFPEIPVFSTVTPPLHPPSPTPATSASPRPQPLPSHPPSSPTLLHPADFLPQTDFASLAQSAHRPSSRPFWRFILGLLSLLLVSGAASWLVWRTRTLAPTPTPGLPREDVRPALPPTSTTKLSPAPPPVPDSPGPAPSDPLELERISALVLDQGSQLFRRILSDPGSRTNLIDQAENHLPSITTFFEKHGSLTAASFQLVPVAPIDLPSGRPFPMLQVTTSAGPDSSGFLRFYSGPDGSLRLDWPLFEETHEHALSAYLSDPADSRSRWFSVGLRRDHGLELDPAERDLYHAFDLQSSAKTVIGAPAIVGRDLPVGRYIDQRAEWGVIHMARLLLRARTLGSGLRALEIVDCEGLGLNSSRPIPVPGKNDVKTVPTTIIPGSPP